MVVAFKRDVGVRSGRSTSEIESWHAIRLDAWLSTFHFPRSTRILETSKTRIIFLRPAFFFYLLSSLFRLLSRAGSIDGGRTRFFALEISKIGDHRAYRESSGMVGRGLLGKVIPARRSTDRYQSVRDEARDQPV